MAEGLRISVRLTPRADRDRIDSVGEDASGRPLLMARVRAVPEKGEANKAVARLVAKELDVPPSRVSVIGGTTNRLKTLMVEGDVSVLTDRLAKVSA